MANERPLPSSAGVAGKPDLLAELDHWRSRAIHAEDSAYLRRRIVEIEGRMRRLVKDLHLAGMPFDAQRLNDMATDLYMAISHGPDTVGPPPHFSEPEPRP
jgi:hypothetical protein